MGETYYTGRNFRRDETRGKYRGFIYHWGVDPATGKRKRYHKTKTFKATGQRAAKQEYLAWCAYEEEEAQRRQWQGDAAGAGALLIPDYVSRYIQSKEAAKSIEASTIRGYENSLRYIREEFSGTPIKDLKAKAVEEWLAKLTAKGFSSSTIGKAYRLLKQVLTDAVNNGVIMRNPLATVKPPKRANKKQGINALDSTGRAALLDKLEALELTPTVVGAYLALYTGMRRGEVCGLQWRDIDESNRVIWVKRSIGDGKGGTYIKQPKTDRARDVALPETLLDILLKWKDRQREDYANNLSALREDSYILGDPLGYFLPNHLTKEWHSISNLLGVYGTEGRLINFHDLRHTWATMFLANGGDVKTAASNLGHANAAMTLNIYASADPDAKRRAAKITETAMRQDGQPIRKAGQ